MPDLAPLGRCAAVCSKVLSAALRSSPHTFRSAWLLRNLVTFGAGGQWAVCQCSYCYYKFSLPLLLRPWPALSSRASENQRCRQVPAPPVGFFNLLKVLNGPVEILVFVLKSAWSLQAPWLLLNPTDLYPLVVPSG